jgi:methylenetetrahydrofolate dehydrogenase (NADP+) / methenyltetrahydrofolate cyclohydrolase
MTAKIIDGLAISKAIRAECATRVLRLQEERNLTPGIAVIMIGDNQASLIYVRNKIKAASEVGIMSRRYEFPSQTEPEDVLCLIDDLNHDAAIHGILVQLPLPPQFNIYSILHRIDPRKDVDGFHLYNVGGLVIGEHVFPPCTPFGVMRLLKHEALDVEGQNVVIVGASNIVGKPMALMMVNAGATVSVCHAKTRDLSQFTILADILIVAAGVPGLITTQMVKAGAIVIDVGINRLGSGKVVGDVDFENVREKVSYITPVPGGVGPMTVAMLIHNTIQAAERKLMLREENPGLGRERMDGCGQIAG